MPLSFPKPDSWWKKAALWILCYRDTKGPCLGVALPGISICGHTWCPPVCVLVKTLHIAVWPLRVDLLESVPNNLEGWYNFIGRNTGLTNKGGMLD